MQVTKVEITVARVVPIDKFETFRYGLTMGFEFEPGEYTEEMYEDLRKEVHRKVQLQIARALPD